jgi:hypothetical protein
MKTPFLSFRFLILTAVVLAGLAGAGCTQANLVRVKPWERAELADALMNPARDPVATGNAEHVYFSREAATGGRGVGGSGCGCN